MSYGLYIEAEMASPDGESRRVEVEARDYSGEVHTMGLAGTGFRIQVGRRGRGFFGLKQSRCNIDFQPQTTEHIQAVKEIGFALSRIDYRVTAYREGTVEFQGYPNPEFIASRINENRTQTVTLGCKDYLHSIDAPWTKEDGSRYTGHIPASELITDIFERHGLAMPLDVGVAWRPAGLDFSEHPLQIEIPAEAFYDTDADGRTTAFSRGDVLQMIARLFQCELGQSDGRWRMVQPFAFKKQEEVTLWQYDAQGANTGSTTATARSFDGLDLEATESGDDIEVTLYERSGQWLRGSDEEEGSDAYNEAIASYNFGEISRQLQNPRFELWLNGSPQYWSTSGTDVIRITDRQDTDSAVGLGGTFVDESVAQEDYDQHTNNNVEQVVQVVEGDTSILLDRWGAYQWEPDTGEEQEFIDPIDPVYSFHEVWVDGPDGVEYLNTDGSGGYVWGSQPEKIEGFLGGGDVGQFELELPEVQITGEMHVRQWGPVAEEVKDSEGNVISGEFYGVWDSIELELQESDVTSERSTTYRQFDPDVESGETLQFVSRLGDGPFESARGTLKLPDGSITGSWRTEWDQENTYPIMRLWTREGIRMHRRGRTTRRLEEAEAQAMPAWWRAVAWGDLFWPGFISHEQAAARPTLELVKLIDAGVPSGEEEFSSTVPVTEDTTVVGGTGGTGQTLSGSTYIDVDDRVLLRRDRTDPLYDQRPFVERAQEVTIYARQYMNGDLAEAVDDAIAAAPVGATIQLPAGTFDWTKQVLIEKDYITIRGANTTLVNAFGGQDDTLTEAFFRFQGSHTTQTFVADDWEYLTRTISVDDNSWAEVGMAIGIENATGSRRNMSLVLGVGSGDQGPFLALDRPIVNPILQGRDVSEIHTVKGSSVENIRFDMDGNYGYGVWGEYAHLCEVKDIEVDSIGSKVVNWQRCFDCHTEDVRSLDAFDTSAGMGYVLRWASSNDCTARQVIGHGCRHVVDNTLASRNFAVECEGYGGRDTDFKTHGNDCWANTFLNCKSVGTNKAGYTIVEVDGDRLNRIIGAEVQKTGLLDGFQNEGTTIIRECTVRGDQLEIIRHGGIVNMRDCYFELRFRMFSTLWDQAALDAEGMDRHDLTFENCQFEVFTQRGLGATRPRDYAIKHTLKGCEVNAHTSDFILETNTDHDVRVLDSEVTYHEDTGSNVPMLITDGSFFIRQSDFTYSGQGGYVLGLRDGAHADVDEVRAENTISGLWRRYTSDCSATLGAIQMLGTEGGTLGVGTLTDLDTNGAPVLPFGSEPPSGAWQKGARYLPEDADDGVMVICTAAGSPGSWERVLTWAEGDERYVKDADVARDLFTTDGDGANTTVEIPHGLGVVPAAGSVTPASEDAAADHYIDWDATDATHLVVEYVNAAPQGTDNVRISWEVRA